MRLMILAGLVVCLLVPIGTVVLRASEDSLIAAVDEAGCRDVDYRYELRGSAVWLAVSVSTCIRSDGIPLGHERAAAAVAAAVWAAASEDFEAVVIWAGQVKDGRLVAPTSPVRLCREELVRTFGPQVPASRQAASTNRVDESEIAIAGVAPLLGFVTVWAAVGLFVGARNGSIRVVYVRSNF